MLARLATLSLALVPAVLAAQEIEDQFPISRFPERLRFGLHGIGTRPLGDFGRAVDGGAWGLGGELRLTVDRPGWLAVRVDGGYNAYGRNRRTLGAPQGFDPFFTSGPGASQLVSDNTMATLMAGLELAVPTGALRPYVHAMAGGSYFQTSTRLVAPAVPTANDVAATNLEDWVGSGAVGGGVRLALARNRTGTTLLDVGARRWFTGPTRYATAAAPPAGLAGPAPALRTRTDAWAITVGVSFAPR